MDGPYFFFKTLLFLPVFVADIYFFVFCEEMTKSIHHTPLFWMSKWQTRHNWKQNIVIVHPPAPLSSSSSSSLMAPVTPTPFINHFPHPPSQFPASQNRPSLYLLPILTQVNRRQSRSIFFSWDLSQKCAPSVSSLQSPYFLFYCFGHRRLSSSCVSV